MAEAAAAAKKAIAVADTGEVDAADARALLVRVEKNKKAADEQARLRVEDDACFAEMMAINERSGRRAVLVGTDDATAQRKEMDDELSAFFSRRFGSVDQGVAKMAASPHAGRYASLLTGWARTRKDFGADWQTLNRAARTIDPSFCEIHDAVVADAKALHAVIAKYPDMPARMAAQVGYRLVQLGEPESAIRLLQDHCERSPEHYLTHAALAASAERLNQPELAGRHASAMLALRPNSLGWTLLARAQAAQRDLHSAVRSARNALEDNAKSPIAYYDLADYLRKLRDFDGAREALDRFFEFEPDHSGGYVRLAHVQLNAGQPALPAAQRAVELGPQNPRAHVVLSFALQSVGRLEESLVAARRGAELDENDALARWSVGLALTDLGRDKEAVVEYRRALALDPEVEAGQNNLSSALLRVGDPDGAIRAARIAIEQQPTNRKAHYNLGLALKTKQDYRGAVAALRTALSFDKNDAWTVAHLAMALGGLGDRAGAFEMNRRAAELFRAEGSHGEAGAALMAVNDYQGAEAELRFAARKDPDNAHHLGNFAFVLLRNDKVDEAIRVLHTCIRLDPGNPKSLHNLSIARHMQHDLKRAVDCASRAIEISPRYAPARFSLGRTKEELGDLPGATQAFQAAVSLAPKDAKYRRWLGRALLYQGKLDRAEPTLRQAAALGDAVAPWLLFLAEMMRRPDVVEGTAEPANAKEALALAFIAQFVRKDYAAAVRHYQRAFPDLEEMVRNPNEGLRFQAAQAAVLAGEHAQAIEWLYADLEAWRQYPQARRARVMVRVWERKLKDARGRKEYRKFWGDVDAFLEELPR